METTMQSYRPRKMLEKRTWVQTGDRLREYAVESSQKIKPEHVSQALGWFSLGLGIAQVAAPRHVSNFIGLKKDYPVLMRLLGMREISSGIGLLTQQKSTAWRWSRVVGDAVDFSLLSAAAASNSAHRSRLLGIGAAVAGISALDILSAQKLNRNGARERVRETAITINRSPEKLYGFWRNFYNLPIFMSHIKSIQVLDDKRSRWTAWAPGGRTVAWEAEITEDRPNELIAWRSMEGADIENSGHVRFKKAPGGRGTEVRVKIEYRPPAGSIGIGIAKLFGKEPGQQIKGDLYRFKQVMETGEVLHSDASMHRRMHPARPSHGHDVMKRKTTAVTSSGERSASV